MTTGNEKCGALVGEKSQTVHSANWKLDAILKREKQMLDISKRRVEHRITMDKQVVRKRFHIKLHRSRLHHARMTGNTEMLQKLLAQGSFDNNYGAANDESLPLPSCSDTRVQGSRRSNSASARLIRAKEREMRATVGSRLHLRGQTPNQVESESQNRLERRRVKTAVGGRYQPLDNKGKSNGRDGDRPKTALRYKEIKTRLPEETRHIGKSTTATIDVDREKKRDSISGVRIRPATADVANTDGKSSINGIAHHGNSLNAVKVTRPKTATGTTNIPEEVQGIPNEKDKIHIEDVANHSLAVSPTHAKSEIDKDSQSAAPSSSIFNERPKVTLLDVQLNRIQRANFPKRIKGFAESIPGHLKVDRSELVDIYSADLVEKLNLENRQNSQSSGKVRSKEGEENSMQSVINQKEEKRCIGNIYAPNMTFKSLNTNYDNVKSECIETIPFQRKSSGLAGILRHKSISKLSIPSTAWESDEEDFDD